MKKIDEMKNDYEALKNEVQILLDEGKISEAKLKMEAVKMQKEAIDLQEQLDKEERDNLILDSKSINNSESLTDPKMKENANLVRAMLKKVAGKSLNEAENSLLLPTTSIPNGSNGESYILPQDIRTQINKKVREYKSLRDALGYMPVGALTGSFPIENFETVSGLIDFADGTDGEGANDIRFTSIKFALKEKAAFIKLSNTLLSLTDNALLAYVVEVFAKKAVITENELGMVQLKENKQVKLLADWKALKTSINVDLDPAALFGTVIITNQDGFDYIDRALDTNGRPILQTNPSDATQKMFNGYPVMVYSNSTLKTTQATKTSKAKAPIFYGNLKEAVKYVDLNSQIAIATSSEAGFMSNTTIARLIEFIDVVQCDSSDKCYIYGEFEVGDIVA